MMLRDKAVAPPQPIPCVVQGGGQTAQAPGRPLLRPPRPATQTTQTAQARPPRPVPPRPRPRPTIPRARPRPGQPDRGRPGWRGCIYVYIETAQFPSWCGIETGYIYCPIETDIDLNSSESNHRDGSVKSREAGVRGWQVELCNRKHRKGDSCLRCISHNCDSKTCPESNRAAEFESLPSSSVRSRHSGQGEDPELPGSIVGQENGQGRPGVDTVDPTPRRPNWRLGAPHETILASSVRV